MLMASSYCREIHKWLRRAIPWTVIREKITHARVLQRMQFIAQFSGCLLVLVLLRFVFQTKLWLGTLVTGVGGHLPGQISKRFSNQ